MDIPDPRQPASSVVLALVRDKTIAEVFSQKLEDYMYIPLDTDEPDPGAFVRYIDRRDFPPVLKPGGYIADCDEDTLTFKAGRRIWKIRRENLYIFQKKRRGDYLLEAAMGILKGTIRGQES